MIIGDRQQERGQVITTLPARLWLEQNTPAASISRSAPHPGSASCWSRTSGWAYSWCEPASCCSKAAVSRRSTAATWSMTRGPNTVVRSWHRSAWRAVVTRTTVSNGHWPTRYCHSRLGTIRLSTGRRRWQTADCYKGNLGLHLCFLNENRYVMFSLWPKEIFHILGICYLGIQNRMLGI